MSRLSDAEALDLLAHADLHHLGRLAREATLRRHRDSIRTYVVDRNVNYTNVCVSGCLFCNFCRPPGHPQAYVLTAEQLLAKVDELVSLGGRQVLLQGGMNPDLPMAWYTRMLRDLKAAHPQLHVHGFSPPEIVFLSRTFGKTISEIIGELCEAGLDTIPGGGAEILGDRVRARISPNKYSAAQWLEVMCQAHRQGVRTTATMMFGHVESDQERIEHLRRLRDLQDETGGFTAFIPWTFQPAGTRLAKDLQPRLAGVQDYLRMLAVARLYLDNFENLQASWVTQGPAVGQVALEFGANDLGSLMLEENVVASAGVRYRLTEAQLRQLIRQAGYIPARRDCFYRLVEEPAATPDVARSSSPEIPG